MTYRRNKFGAIKTTLDGIAFASKKEAHRWGTLRILMVGGKITNLERQPEYLIEVNGIKICKYIADFRYLDKETGATIVEDVKGIRTPVFNLKKKLVEACFGIEVTLV